MCVAAGVRRRGAAQALTAPLKLQPSLGVAHALAYLRAAGAHRRCSSNIVRWRVPPELRSHTRWTWAGRPDRLRFVAVAVLMAAPGLSTVVALSKKAFDFQHAGHRARSAAYFGHAQAAALALGAEDCLIVALLQVFE